MAAGKILKATRDEILKQRKFEDEIERPYVNPINELHKAKNMNGMIIVVGDRYQRTDYIFEGLKGRWRQIYTNLKKKKMPEEIKFKDMYDAIKHHTYRVKYAWGIPYIPYSYPEELKKEIKRIRDPF